jgi:hypothetical protein
LQHLFYKQQAQVFVDFGSNPRSQLSRAKYHLIASQALFFLEKLLADTTG